MSFGDDYSKLEEYYMQKWVLSTSGVDNSIGALPTAGGVLHAEVSHTSGVDNSVGALTTAGGVLHAEVSCTSGLDNRVGALTTAAVHGIIKGTLPS